MIKSMSIYIFKLIKLLFPILIVMTNIYPKNNKIWGFKGFDNSKYLFEYINQHRKDIYCIWTTENKETLNYYKK
jgi:hypothetical protein